MLCVTAHGTRDEGWWQFPAPERGSYLKRVGRLSAQDISVALMWLFADKMIVFHRKQSVSTAFSCSCFLWLPEGQKMAGAVPGLLSVTGEQPCGSEEAWPSQ